MFCKYMPASSIFPTSALHWLATVLAISQVLTHLSPRTVCVCVQDKINAFWEISKKELEDTRAQLRNKDREMEELEERHQVEIKVWAPKSGC
jgi:hypothetical protein